MLTGLDTLTSHLIEIAGAVDDAEGLRDAHSRNPDDLAVADQDREAIPVIGVDFTINEDVFHFSCTSEAKRTEAVARPSGADEE